MKMKAYKTMKAILAIAMVGFSIYWTVEPAIASPMRGHTILIVPKPSPEDEPRTNVPNPFFAELMDDSVTILLSVTNPCGIVSIQITSTAGDNYSAYFDTSDGAILLPISGNTGNYSMTITLSNGFQFVGGFTI
jgi:hypothetical protein